MKKIFLVNFKDKKKNNKNALIGGDKYDNDLLKVFYEMGFDLKYMPMNKSKWQKLESFIKLVLQMIFYKNRLYFFRYPLFYISMNAYHMIYIYQFLLYKVMYFTKNKVGVIISDLDYARCEGFENVYKDINFLKNFDYIIVHNNIMKDFLIENSLDEKKLIDQEIGNNLSSNFIVPKRKLSKILVFSGNLSKSRFLSKFTNENIVSYKINLYGIGFNKKNENKILKYKGSYSSEDIVKILDGSFGLIWDGDDINICSGLYGEYMKINNPSKFSQYIVAGLPIITWKEAAVAKVIKKYNIGFVVNNLIEIDDVLNNLTEEKYNIYLKNVMNLREKVMKGYHFKKAINEVFNIVENDKNFYC